MVKQISFPILDGGSNPTSPLQLFVQEIDKSIAREFYKKWHYLGNKGFLSSFNFGAFFDNCICGAISFHPPSALETVKGAFGIESQDGIWEIGRLAMTDECPKNSESRFIAISIKLLRKITNVRAIITYADSSVGHTGTIYRASGFTYCGLTASKKDFWVNDKIQERGKTKGINGEWKPRSRKHKFVKVFDSRLKLKWVQVDQLKEKE